MGYPGKNRKQYETPAHRFEKTRMEEEVRLLVEYGLRNKRELWKAQSILRRYRRAARDLLALMSTSTSQELVERRKNDLLGHLRRMGYIGENAGIEDVLALNIEKLLEGRLQTVVYRRGLARSPKQARQFITHGHIAIGDSRVTIPGYRVRAEELHLVRYHSRSPLNNELHPEKVRIVKGGR